MSDLRTRLNRLEKQQQQARRADKARVIELVHVSQVRAGAPDPDVIRVVLTGNISPDDF